MTAILPSLGPVLWAQYYSRKNSRKLATVCRVKKSYQFSGIFCPSFCQQIKGEIIRSARTLISVFFAFALPSLALSLVQKARSTSLTNLKPLTMTNRDLVVCCFPRLAPFSCFTTLLNLLLDKGTPIPVFPIPIRYLLIFGTFQYSVSIL